MSHKTMSATEARIHFGELLQEAQKGPVTVERDGQPVVVVLSKHEYDALTKTSPSDWRAQLEQLHQRLRVELQGKTLPDPAELLREIREERDERYDLH